MNENILEMNGITKIYPNGFIANERVDFSVKKGEIHALMGENGAGKSTLMKVLFGIEKPEEGTIKLKNEEVVIKNPQEAIKKGIGMVHQHFMLVPSLTVAENIVLGAEPLKKGFLNYEEAVKMTEETSKKYNLIINPKAKTGDLPVGMKQKVEILKALLRGAEILILDEPTAVLTPQETKELFVQLKSLKENGYTIIFISHKLKEIKELCDRITILRNGRSIVTEDVAKLTEKDISRMMVGRDVVLSLDKVKAEPKKTALKVRNLVLVNEEEKTIINNISFSVRYGEILGIAGVEGNGQRELSEIIAGLGRATSGEIIIAEHNADHLNVRKIRELSVSHISEDRMTYGVVANGTIMENLISDRYYKKEYNKNFLLNRKKIETEAKLLIENYGIKCDNFEQPVRMLSGGNIQKVVAAREFSAKPKLIIANQPTRGIDVGASEFIRKKLVELRDKDSAVILISADLSEVMEVSDSLIVMNGGEIVAYIEDAKKISEEELGEYMLGLKRQKESEIGRVSYE